MKQEEIKIRINSGLKNDFQEICEKEHTTMSNKLNSFIVKEVKTKKTKTNPNSILTKKLIRFGIVNTNGRLYLKDELTRTKLNEDGFEYTELERLNNGIFYGQYNYGDSEITHKYNATHSISNFRIEDDWLLGDITILNQSILPIIDNLVFRPRSFGNMCPNGVVKDLDIIGFDAILKSEDTFIENGNENL
jgi:hypothetical protein